MHRPGPCLSIPERDCRVGRSGCCSRCPHKRTFEQNAAWLMRSWAHEVEYGRATVTQAVGHVLGFVNGVEGRKLAIYELPPNDERLRAVEHD